MKTLLTLIGFALMQSTSFANEIPPTLDLVCVPQSESQFAIYQVIIEPELLSTIPENPLPGPIHTGEFIAVVKANLYSENEQSEILFSKDKEFQLTPIQQDEYLFISEKLHLKLICNPNGVASGGGGFSGTN